MKNFFTISEFAHLRNININSLRYYEKIGLLIPAYIDPETKYRYYSSEQLYLLDVIRLCIDLGIPLKEMINYVDSQGELQIRSIFQDGKQLAQDKMEEIQRSLKRIEHTLDFLDTNNVHKNQSGLYTRYINSRTVFTANESSTLGNFDNNESAFTYLFEQALIEGLSPVLPSGIIVTDTNGQHRYRQFLEVVGDGAAHDDVMTIPAGNYKCLQIQFRADMDIKNIIEENFSSEKQNPIIVSNMFSSKFYIENIRTELQQLQATGEGTS